MIQKPLHPSHLSQWKFPIDVNCYDQQPELREMERLALEQALRHCYGKRKRQLPRDAEQKLTRLILPLHDI